MTACAKLLLIAAVLTTLAAPAQTTPATPGVLENNGLLTVTNKTLTQLADTLTQELSTELGRVVIDKTGIQGKYDFVLKFNPEAEKALPDDDSPSIFIAIQEQLGLKLESTKGPVTVLVVDHAEMPEEN